MTAPDTLAEALRADAIWLDRIAEAAAVTDRVDCRPTALREVARNIRRHLVVDLTADPTATEQIMAWLADDREGRRIEVTIEAGDPEYDDDTDEVIDQPYHWTVDVSGVDFYGDDEQWVATHHVASGDSFETAARGVLGTFGS